MAGSTRSAFTLIELLVVITIIIVLLALLTPALDKAMYEAKLASCGARLDALATSAATYAIQYRRQYPHRQRPTEDYTRPRGIQRPNNWSDRPILRQAFSLNGVFNCPLAAQLDIGGSE